MAGLVSLPNELLKMIAACHASDPHCILELASLARVNRRLNSVANPILYDLDWRRHPHDTPRSLKLAIFVNRIETLALIESLGFDINRNGKPLELACAYGELRTVTWLLDHGMPIFPQSLALWTAMTRRENEDVALLLLGRGANPHVRPSVRPSTTYIHEAAWLRRMRVLKVLVREKGVPIDIKNSKGHTILNEAMQKGQEDIAREVITLGADVNAETGGELLLTSAVQLGQFRIAAMLLAAGAIVKPRRPGDGVAYPIHVCARLSSRLESFHSSDEKRLHQKEQCGVLTRLVDAGADLDERYKNGYTPLEEAVMKGTLETIRHLLDIGADNGMKDTNGRIVLSLLVSNPDMPNLIERAVVLLRAGARMDVPLANGKSLLEWAIDRVYEIHKKDLPQRLLDVATRSVLTYEYLDDLLYKYTHSRQYEVCPMLIRHGAALKDLDLIYETVKARLRLHVTGERWIELGFDNSRYFNAMVGMGLPMQKLADLLPYAFEANYAPYVETLVNYGVLSFSPERPEWLHMAAKWGDVGIIRRMMRYPVDVNHLSESTTPLRMAIRHRHIEIAWVLLNHGADPFLPRNTRDVSAFEAATQTYDDLRLVKEMWSKPTSQDRPDLSAIISNVPVKHDQVVGWLRLQVKPQDQDQVTAQDQIEAQEGKWWWQRWAICTVFVAMWLLQVS
ncbi:hypothetical protein Hte_001279 [Hypoxylon texense]